MTAHFGTTTRDELDWSTECLNCGAVLGGPFGAHCGQRALPPHSTTKELAGDAYSELIGWDGKLARTVRLLLRHPGEPLTCSVLYFLLAATAPPPSLTNVDVDVGVADAPTAGELAFAKAMSDGYAQLTPVEKAAIEETIVDQPRFFRPMLRALATDYQGVQRRITSTMPRALFVLVPVLALVLRLFYRRRHFPDHLYFAMHFQAFVFLVLSLVAAAGYTRLLTLVVVAQIAAASIVLAYGLLAQRRVYGGTWLATGLKAIGVAVLYGVAWSTTTVVVTLWVSR